MRVRPQQIGTICGWLATGGMAVVASARMVRSETQPLLIGVQGIAVWLLVPAYPLAAISYFRRKRTMAAATLALCLVQAGLAFTAIGWQGPQPAPVGASALRLVTANVLIDNAEVEYLAHDLAQSGADVIVLQEVTPVHLEAMRHTDLWATYPNRVLDALPGFLGSAVFSRLPITDGGPLDISGYPMTQVDITTPAGPLRIVDVHTVAPVSTANAVVWKAQLETLRNLRPPAGFGLVLAGDFNATLDHAPMQRLLDGGLTDAFTAAGSGYGATWPRWAGPTFPLMRLDHVLVSQQISVVSIRTEDSRGSDHRRLVVDLALPTAQ